MGEGEEEEEGGGHQKQSQKTGVEQRTCALCLHSISAPSTKHKAPGCWTPRSPAALAVCLPCLGLSLGSERRGRSFGVRSAHPQPAVPGPGSKGRELWRARDGAFQHAGGARHERRVVQSPEEAGRLHRGG